MFSGKTTELIRRYNRYKLAGKKCLMIKYIKDDRYNKLYVTTHDNNKIEAISCEFLKNIEHIIVNYEVLCIDEIQFYKDAHIYADKWANNQIVEVCGLNGDYKREAFEQISLIIPKVENITFLTAIDKVNGKYAPFTKRIVNNNNIELIGGKELYEACSRENFKL